jgi:hypothetical protein
MLLDQATLTEFPCLTEEDLRRNRMGMLSELNAARRLAGLYGRVIGIVVGSMDRVAGVMSETVGVEIHDRGQQDARVVLSIADMQRACTILGGLFGGLEHVGVSLETSASGRVFIVTVAAQEHLLGEMRRAMEEGKANVSPAHELRRAQENVQASQQPQATSLDELRKECAQLARDMLMEELVDVQDPESVAEMVGRLQKDRCTQSGCPIHGQLLPRLEMLQAAYEAAGLGVSKH